MFTVRARIGRCTISSRGKAGLDWGWVRVRVWVKIRVWVRVRVRIRVWVRVGLG